MVVQYCWSDCEESKSKRMWEQEEEQETTASVALCQGISHIQTDLKSF